MRITLDIQDGKALAFLNFNQSLDFVTINSEESANEKEFVLSDEQLKLLEERRNDLMQGKSQFKLTNFQINQLFHFHIT